MEKVKDTIDTKIVNAIFDMDNQLDECMRDYTFIDDIELQIEDTNIIQETFNDINQEVSKLNIEIKTKKCKPITNNIGETITNINKS